MFVCSLTALAGTLEAILNRGVENGHPHLVPDLTRKALTLSSL